MQLGVERVLFTIVFASWERWANAERGNVHVLQQVLDRSRSAGGIGHGLPQVGQDVRSERHVRVRSRFRRGRAIVVVVVIGGIPRAGHAGRCLQLGVHGLHDTLNGNNFAILYIVWFLSTFVVAQVLTVLFVAITGHHEIVVLVRKERVLL
jgi:hypothetical protein